MMGQLQQDDLRTNVKQRSRKHWQTPIESQRNNPEAWARDPIAFLSCSFPWAISLRPQPAAMSFKRGVQHPRQMSVTSLSTSNVKAPLTREVLLTVATSFHRQRHSQWLH
eukprot:227114-Amphidinium_carterae.1